MEQKRSGAAEVPFSVYGNISSEKSVNSCGTTFAFRGCGHDFAFLGGISINDISIDVKEFLETPFHLTISIMNDRVSFERPLFIMTNIEL